MSGALVSLHATPDVTQRLLELLAVLLSDVVTDIGVAARDLGITDASFIRLQRARDRLVCVQGLLETMAEIDGKATSGQAGPLEVDGDAEGELEAIATAMRGAVELLTREWPEDYPDGAVEWLHSVLHFNRAIAFEELGRLEDAECSYKRCLELDPSRPRTPITIWRHCSRRAVTSRASYAI
jgi:tetratricopeptide (TPR) repeat protein